MKHEIEIQGDIPAVYTILGLQVCKRELKENIERVGCILELEKIQPRRVTFEATNDYHEPEDKNAIHTQIFIDEAETAVKIVSNVKWKLVKKSDLSSNLSVDDCKAIMYHLSTEIDNSIYEKLDKFIKDNS